MHLRTTWADWLHDLRCLWVHRLMHDPTRSSAIVRSFARPVVPFTATGCQTNCCMRSKFCISPNVHDRLYVLQIDRNGTTIQCGLLLKTLSQLAPDRFKTLCDRKFSNSYVLSLPLHDASHLFYAIKWSHQVASDF